MIILEFPPCAPVLFECDADDMSRRCCLKCPKCLTCLKFRGKKKKVCVLYIGKLDVCVYCGQALCSRQPSYNILATCEQEVQAYAVKTLCLGVRHQLTNAKYTIEVPRSAVVCAFKWTDDIKIPKAVLHAHCSHIISKRKN